MNGTKDYYNKTADEWAKNGYSDDYEMPCLEDFLSLMNPHSKILDLGCGCGYDCKRLKERGFLPVGVDFSEKSLEIAKSFNPEIEFFCSDILSDYSFIGKVDAIMSIACLVHIENNDLNTAFEQMSKVLNADGLLLFSIRYGNGKINEQSLRFIDGVSFDRNFIGHTLEEILQASKERFEYVRKMETDMPIWEYHLLKRKKEQ